MTGYAPSASIQEEVLTFLSSSPTPERIIDFHASDAAQARLRYLLDANREGTLSPEERAEMDEASQMNTSSCCSRRRHTKRSRANDVHP